MRILDLGSGPHPDPRATDGIDFYPYHPKNLLTRSPYPETTIIHDLTVFPWPYPDDTFDGAFAHQVIEHLPVEGVAGNDLFFRFFDEAHRILKPGGEFEFDVPHVDGPDAFADPTHRRFFTEKSFEFLWDSLKDPLYPRKIWWLVSRKTIHGLWLNYHVRKYLPRLANWADRKGFGTPHVIRVTLKKRYL